MLKYEIVINNKCITYLLYDQKHRKDYPARIWLSGDFGYWEYGERHRKDGPAVISGRAAYKEYYLRGIKQC